MRQLITINTPRFGRVLPAVLPAAFMAACLLLAKPAHAIDFTAVFTVNFTSDEPDASVGDNVCATSGGACTLRAAIQEANVTTAAHTINFNKLEWMSLARPARAIASLATRSSPTPASVWISASTV